MLLLYCLEIKELCICASELISSCPDGIEKRYFITLHVCYLCCRLIELAVHNEKTRLFSRQYSSEIIQKLVPDFVEV